MEKPFLTISNAGQRRRVDQESTTNPVTPLTRVIVSDSTERTKTWGRGPINVKVDSAVPCECSHGIADRTATRQQEHRTLRELRSLDLKNLSAQSDYWHGEYIMAIPTNDASCRGIAMIPSDPYARSRTGSRRSSLLCHCIC